MASGVAAILAQGHAVQPLEKFSFSLRFDNALVSGVIYLWQMIYPAGLAVFYPYPVGGLPSGEVAGRCCCCWPSRRGFCFGGESVRGC